MNANTRECLVWALICLTQLFRGVPWKPMSALAVGRTFFRRCRPFGPVSLIASTGADDDTVDFRCAKTNDLSVERREHASETDCWQEFVGTPFGWGWITVNQQGYCDGLLLSLAESNQMCFSTWRHRGSSYDGSSPNRRGRAKHINALICVHLRSSAA